MYTTEGIGALAVYSSLTSLNIADVHLNVGWFLWKHQSLMKLNSTCTCVSDCAVTKVGGVNEDSVEPWILSGSLQLYTPKRWSYCIYFTPCGAKTFSLYWIAWIGSKKRNKIIVWKIYSPNCSASKHFTWQCCYFHKNTKLALKMLNVSNHYLLWCCQCVFSCWPTVWHFSFKFVCFILTVFVLPLVVPKADIQPA